MEANFISPETLAKYFEKPRTFFFTAQSGAGKETQSNKLIDFIVKNDPNKRKILRVVTGDLFRDWIKKSGEENYAAKRIKAINDKGGIQSPVLAVRLLLNYLIDNYTGEEHLIFDGSPRSISEAEMMLEILSERLYDVEKPILAIVLKVSDETAFSRLIERNKAHKRTETSTPENIMAKLSWFHTHVVPAILYMKITRGTRMIEIDGEKEPEEVFKEMIQKLFPF
jgi:adenylate kinase family enzyme